MNGLLYRKAPCRSCPWRRDVEPGAFGADRYEQLAETCGRDGYGPDFGAPVFACHLSIEGQEQACAGFLAVAGERHPNVRLAVARGDIPAEALSPGRDWPPLFDSFDQMAAVQAAPVGTCAIQPPRPTGERG